MDEGHAGSLGRSPRFVADHWRQILARWGDEAMRFYSAIFRTPDTAADGDIGTRPRLRAGAWVLFGIAAVSGSTGAGRRLPSWLVERAPFGLLDDVPAEAPDVTGTLVAGVGGRVLVVLGVVGFRRRDVPMH